MIHQQPRSSQIFLVNSIGVLTQTSTANLQSSLLALLALLAVSLRICQRSPCASFWTVFMTSGTDNFLAAAMQRLSRIPEHSDPTLWWGHNSYWNWPFIVSFQSKMVIFHSYVSSTEDKRKIKHLQRIGCVAETSDLPASCSDLSSYMMSYVFL